MTLSRSNPRAKPRWLLLLAVVAALVMAFAATSLAVHDVGEFELDKDASNDLNHLAVGYLNSNITATATSINVCRTGAAVTAGDTLLIRAEEMTVSAVAAGSFGGSCSGTKETYTVARGANSTTARAQSGGANNIGARVSKIVDAALPDGPDWDQVYAEVLADADTKCEALGLAECAFIEDGIGPSIYTVGSTKDHLPISGWFHTTGSSPDKGEILNAYAAKAIDDNDDQILYFGMDRYAVDGSTDIGFWFFQRPVVACPDASAGDACEDVPDGEFAGEHADGDILLLGTFTQGGAASNIRVFTWSGDPETGTAIGPSDTYGDCVAAGLGDDGCATVNNTTIPVPWNYTFKGESVGRWIPAGGSFEGGINLSQEGLEGCFSSFLAETRASPEITAILKDFALGSFEACDTELTTTPADDTGTPLGDADEDDLPDIAIGTGAAGVDVTDSAVLDVKGISEWDGTLDFYLCGPIADPGLCETGGVLVTDDLAVDETTTQPIVSDSANVTEVGRYCWRAEFTSGTEGVPDAIDPLVDECFEVLPVQPTLDTNVVDAAGNALTGAVPFGDPLYDKAVLSGTAYQPGDDGGTIPGDPASEYPSINATMDTEANGSITFTLVGPGDCTTVAGALSGSTGTNPETGVTVDGDGNYFSSGFTPDAPGDYSWKASYTGDSPNTLSATHNDLCGDTDEDVTVQQLQPNMGTAQSFVPNDSATITVDAGAGDLAGSVVFKLYVNDSDCSDTPAYTSSAIDISSGTGTGLSRTVGSANTAAYSTTGTTFHWVVEFTSTNAAHLGVTSGCGNEDSSITIDNGVTQAPAPPEE